MIKKTLTTIILGTSIFFSGCTIRLYTESFNVEKVETLNILPEKREYLNPNEPKYRNVNGVYKWEK